MNRSLTAALLGCIFFAAAQAQERPRRSAEAILADFDGVAYPSFSDGSDPESKARFAKAIDDAAHRQEALALELLETHPKHARVSELLRMRWQLLVNVDRDFARVRSETEHFVGEGTEGGDKRLAPVAFALRAWACIDDESLPFATRQADVESALEHAPAEFLSQAALLELVQRKSCDVELQRKAAERLARMGAGDEEGGSDARRLAKLVELVGKPLDAELVDDRTRKAYRLAELRGHPVVVSFLPSPWAEQEPAEAAALKKLGGEFGERGLELVVVHELYDPDDLADRRRHAAELALPGRSQFDVVTPEDSLKKRLLRVDLPVVSLLIDRDGNLAAFCFDAAPLREAVARACETARKRRAI